MRFQKGNDPRRNLAGRPTNKIPKDPKSAAQYIFERQKYRIHEDMQTWRYAVDDFENIYQYRREFLHRIYRQIIVDPHLTSQWNTRKMKTIERQYKIVDKEGNKNQDLENILKSSWFYDLLNGILDSRLWGFSLIEFGPVENSQFIDYKGENNKIYPGVNIIDRDYVKPEFGIVVKEMGLITGLNIHDPEFADQLLLIGEKHNAGLLFNMAKYILFKDNCIANWSEWSELFGQDLRIVKSTAEGDDRKRLLQQLKQIGSSGYGIIDPDDMFEFHGTARTDAYKVYNELIDYIDTQISKLIFGQDVVTNNTGRIVGTVGENISNIYGNADGEFVKSILNTYCFPRFTKLGIGNFDGYSLEWDTTEKMNLTQKADVDLKISQMGFRIDPDYIQETYGTVLDKENPTEMNEVQQAEKIKSLYK